MCVLLYLPGLLVILFKRRGLVSTLVHVLALAATQALIGMPFLLEYPKTYLKFSYEFSRVFLFKWTVNWRFLGEDLFLNPTWAKGFARKGAALHGSRRYDEGIAAYDEGLQLEGSPALKKGLQEIKDAKGMFVSYTRYCCSSSWS